jgi:hypothetical protein
MFKNAFFTKCYWKITSHSSTSCDLNITSELKFRLGVAILKLRIQLDDRLNDEVVVTGYEVLTQVVMGVFALWVGVVSHKI